MQKCKTRSLFELNSPNNTMVDVVKQIANSPIGQKVCIVGIIIVVGKPIVNRICDTIDKKKSVKLRTRFVSVSLSDYNEPDDGKFEGCLVDKPEMKPESI